MAQLRPEPLTPSEQINLLPAANNGNLAFLLVVTWGSYELYTHMLHVASWWGKSLTALSCFILALVLVGTRQLNGILQSMIRREEKSHETFQ